jgi:hypothetical protein
MTVAENTNPINSSFGNGVTTVFPYQFTVLDSDDITVAVNGVVTTTGFTVSGVGVPGGGNVTFTTAPANGALVVRYLDPALKREADYQQFGDWLAPAVNNDFDRLWIGLQGVNKRIDTALRVSLSDVEDGLDTMLPAPQGGHALVWAADGLSIVNGELGTGTSLISLAAASGAALIGLQLPGTGSVLRTVEGKLNEIVTVKDKGATGLGVADDSAAFENAPNGAFVFGGTYKVETAPTTEKALITFGATFTGANRPDLWEPGFGPADIRVLSRGANNAIVGATLNNKASGTMIYPTGVTGYGRVNNQGNVVFGLFGQAAIYAAGGGVAAGAEINSMNFAAAPAAGTGTTVNRAFGTTEVQPICLTIGSGGTHDSTVGIHIVKEGSAPRQFLNGITMEYDAIKEYGLFVKAHSTLGNALLASAVLQNRTGLCLSMQNVGTPALGNAFLTYFDNAAAVKFGVRESGKLIFGTGITQTTVGAAGAASALPSNPVGYVMFEANGFEYVFPYYLKS